MDAAAASGAIHDAIGEQRPTTTTTTADYFCHSTMFHSYYTLSHRRYVNAFLHVVIDQGIMQLPYVAIMMLITTSSSLLPPRRRRGG